MKTRKATAFWATFWALLAVYVFTVFTLPSAIAVVGPTIIGALAFAGFGYQAAQVGDAWQKSAHYRPELDRDIATKKIPKAGDDENGG
jgi:hypothetical protein